jgi:hypothetical protein
LHSLSSNSKVGVVSSYSPNNLILFCLVSSVRFLCLWHFCLPLISFIFSATFFSFVCWT